jgi:phenylpyruvate tautomerase PptA (4-oxalocrotonate tautomerase family)
MERKMRMTITQKNELITQVTQLLNKLIDVDTENPTSPAVPLTDKPLEMLTVKECATLVDGLSEHTVRQLCAQDKIVHVRAGAGRNGKILVSKVSLLKYLGVAS